MALSHTKGHMALQTETRSSAHIQDRKSSFRKQTKQKMAKSSLPSDRLTASWILNMASILTLFQTWSTINKQRETQSLMLLVFLKEKFLQ